ncbi:hypothetical protein I79_013256 [Cricetulus griseus]|uniref:Uncharacterized protein n=1 Tax=Cricetulus griseus TaxID=10029 RepID=G3HQZ7_CRIGR|nr:hypothetical protein I79_013256 [Cricetulus griseus]
MAFRYLLSRFTNASGSLVWSSSDQDTSAPVLLLPTHQETLCSVRGRNCTDLETVQ